MLVCVYMPCSCNTCVAMHLSYAHMMQSYTMHHVCPTCTHTHKSLLCTLISTTNRAEKEAEDARKKEEKRLKAEEAKHKAEEAKRVKAEGKKLQALGFQDSKQLHKSRNLMQVGRCIAWGVLVVLCEKWCRDTQ